jgi:Beta-propeller repeat
VKLLKTVMMCNYKCNFSRPFAQKLGALLVVALNFVTLVSSNAQAPAFAWAKKPDGTGIASASAAATDASGNLYITGYLSTTNVTFGTITLTNSGASDVFLLKYDPDGNVVWARQAGGNGFTGLSLCLDGSGNVFIAGYFTAASTSFGGSILTNATGTHCFVMKYDHSGNPVWATQSSGDGREYGRKVAVDALGNVYLTGEFTGTNCTFGTNIFDSTQNSSFGSDVFVTKYDQQGNLLWAKRAGGVSDDHAGGVGVDAAGNCYIAGTFGIPSMTFENTTLNANGYYNIFLAKYDNEGTLLWAKGAGRPDRDFGNFGADWANALAVDSVGNSYLAGVLGSASISFDEIAITNRGVSDMFVAKYDTAGNILWATNYGGVGYDGTFDMALDSAKNVYVLGGFMSTNSIFGTATLTNNSGNEQMFIAKIDTDGSPVWAQQTTGNGTVYPYGIAVDSKGNTYAVGYFNLAANFGNTTLTVDNYTMFVAKLDGPPLLKTTITSGQLVLTWPTYQADFVLESTSNPSGNATWTPVTISASIIGDQYVVTDEISGVSKFYRLRKP